MGRKVELGELIEQLLKDVKAVDGNDELSRSEKTKRMGRLAERLKNKLYEDRRRKGEDKLMPSSYRRYLTIVRKAITEQNWRHHSIEESAQRLAKKHPRYAAQLLALIDHQDISALRVAHHELLIQIRQDKDLDAYEEVSEMKLDHEIMRHLTLPKATKVQLAAEAVEAREVKATNTVEINYHWLIDTISELFYSVQIRDGVAAPYFSHLALGIALATGRREIEVVKQGRFEKVGEFELEFSGQAKRRAGVDYASSYRIYTLVAADVVLEAIAKLRSLPEAIELQHLDNVAINNRVHSNLNQLAKRVLGSQERVFKDSRPIWARVVFELHFNRDPKWKGVNEDIFWREQLGHEDTETQQTYKQFKITYAKPEGADQVESKFASRIEALRDLDKHEKIDGREAMLKIHNWVKSTVETAPDARITQKAISVNVGSYRPLIKEYLELASEALATPNRPIRAVAPVVPAEVANAKPRISLSESDGQWTAVAKLNGVEVARGTGDSRESAYSALLAQGSDTTRD